jgi:hypothetical protein
MSYVTHYLHAALQGNKAVKRGPKPIGETPMTVAERQARYRAVHADGAPKVRYRKPADRRSKPKQWDDAVSTLLDILDDYQDWRDRLPPGLTGSATGLTVWTRCLRYVIWSSSYRGSSFPRASGATTDPQGFS